MYEIGITPAYAGTAFDERLVQRKIGDHPRIRGNSLFITSPVFSSQGSPPHTREQLFPNSNQIQFHRITPAYAGTAPPGDTGITWSGDHPRIRGNSEFGR